jgi:transcriptional regulator of acetoin/glycerol metabolism
MAASMRQPLVGMLPASVQHMNPAHASVIDLPAPRSRRRFHGTPAPATAVPGERLLTLSRPALENLHRLIGRPDAIVVLADRHGAVLSMIGNTRPPPRDRAPGVVATPILAPGQGVLGTLDMITKAHPALEHAGALLRITAEQIEHLLIHNLDEGCITLRFHHHAELLGSPLEALAVFDGNGQLIASNRPARSLLALDPTHPSADSEECFNISWPQLLDRAQNRPGSPFVLAARRGARYTASASLSASSPPGCGMDAVLPSASRVHGRISA